VIQISADRLAPLPRVVVNPSADYFNGVIRLNGGLTLFLAPERLHPDSLPNAGGPVSEAEGSDATSAASTLSGTTSAHVAGRTRGQVLVFRTAEPDPVEHALAFGFSISQVPEILGSLPLTPVPGAAAFVLGLVNWRGRPVPVIDLGRRLGLGSSLADGRTRLVIARDAGRLGKDTWIGFRVWPAIQLLRLPVPHEPSSRSLSIDETLIRGVVELEGETLVIPDLHTIMHVDP
jgi:purine-binding chemotaxis protein CheW